MVVENPPVAGHIICMTCWCLIRQADVDRHYQAVHPEHYQAVYPEMVEADTGRGD